MTYIISPAWFYWLGVMDALQAVVIISLVISAVTFATALIVYFTNFEHGDNDRDVIAAKKVIKVTLPWLIISALLMVFLPTKETLIEMQVARYATYENAELTVDAIKNAVDYIVDAMKQLK